MKNPQADFEDSIFGANGMHPAPKSLPYPTQPLKTLYGDTIEYIIPEGQKEKVLKKLYPFGDPPPLNSLYVDIHSHREFMVRDFKVIEQNGYVMPVSPYFAEDGASVVDWQPKDVDGSGVHVMPMVDEVQQSAFSAGHADGFTGMPYGTAKPVKGETVSEKRFRVIEAAYDEGYEAGKTERDEMQGSFRACSSSSSIRISARRHR